MKLIRSAKKKWEKHQRRKKMKLASKIEKTDKQIESEAELLELEQKRLDLELKRQQIREIKRSMPSRKKEIVKRIAGSPLGDVFREMKLKPFGRMGQMASGVGSKRDLFAPPRMSSLLMQGAGVDNTITRFRKKTIGR